MADPLKNEDIYTDPDLAPVPPALPGTPPAFGALPPAPGRLKTTAGSLGSSVGTAVRRVNNRLPARLKIAHRNDFRTADLERGTVDEFKDAAQEHIQDWRESSRRAVHQLRLQAYKLRRDYPVHTILAFGATGFIVGAILRAWRSK